MLENGVLNGAANPDWVDEYLLCCNNNDCIVLGEPVPDEQLPERTDMSWSDR